MYSEVNVDSPQRVWESWVFPVRNSANKMNLLHFNLYLADNLDTVWLLRVYVVLCCVLTPKSFCDGHALYTSTQKFTAKIGHNIINNIHRYLGIFITEAETELLNFRHGTLNVH